MNETYEFSDLRKQYVKKLKEMQDEGKPLSPDCIELQEKMVNVILGLDAISGMKEAGFGEYSQEYRGRVPGNSYRRRYSMTGNYPMMYSGHGDHEAVREELMYMRENAQDPNLRMAIETVMSRL